MRDYVLMLGLLLKNQSRNRIGKNGKMSQGAVIALSCLPMEIIICVALYHMTLLCVQHSIVAELINLVVTAAELVIFFFLIQSILTVLYATDDSAFVSSLPLKPSSVFLARLTQVYLNELAIAAYLLFPVLLTIGITADLNGYPLSAGFYPLTILIVAVAPFLPLVLATLLSLPLIWLSSFFKKRAAFSTIALILLFTVVFTAYFLIVPNMGDISNVENLSDGIIRFFRTFSTVMYPNKVLVEFCVGINAGINFAIFAAIWMGVAALIITLAAFFYKRAVRAGLETGASAFNTKQKVESEKKLLSALMLNDFRNLIRFPSLAVSSCINIVLAPILTCVMFVFMKDSPSEFLSGEIAPIGMIFFYSVILCGGANNVASLAFTREGQSFFIARHLPIPAKTAVTEKFLLAYLFSIAAIIPLFIIAVALVKMHIVNALLFALLLAVTCAGLNALSIYTDMKRPILDWKNTTDIQKNNFRVIIPTLIGMAIGVGVLLLGVVVSPLVGSIGTVGASAVFWSVSFVVGIAFCIAFCYILFDRCEELYENLAANADKNSARRKERITLSSGGFGKGKNGGMLG